MFLIPPPPGNVLHVGLVDCKWDDVDETELPMRARLSVVTDVDIWSHNELLTSRMSDQLRSALAGSMLPISAIDSRPAWPGLAMFMLGGIEGAGGGGGAVMEGGGGAGTLFVLLLVVPLVLV